MHLADHDDQERWRRRRQPSGPRPRRRGWNFGCAGQRVLLHPAAGSFRRWRQRGVDRQLHAACALSALVHRGDACLSWNRLLARLPLVKDDLRRRFRMRPPIAKPAGIGRTHRGNRAGGRGARLRLHCADLSHHVDGDLRMIKRFAFAAAGGALASSAVFAADETVTLAVQNMSCADCPFIVRKSLENVPGVSKVTVSYKEKTAIVTYDGAKVDVTALTGATTKAGYPSAPNNQVR